MPEFQSERLKRWNLAAFVALAAVGAVVPFWPHVPMMYVLIWVLTIPPIILIHLKGGTFFPFRIELGKLARAASGEKEALHGATAT